MTEQNRRYVDEERLKDKEIDAGLRKMPERLEENRIC